MDTVDLTKLKWKLSHFLRRFYGSIKTVPSRRHFRTYIQGQLSDLERKSIEPMALAAGVPPRSLQEFVEIHRWEHAQMRNRLQEVVRSDHADAHAMGLIDETSFTKKGNHTVGVQPQYCGATGKTDNCVVSVHLGYATEDFHCLLDSDLFLPEETWSQDRERGRQAGIPDAVVYRPKWRIGLDLLRHAWQQGVRFAYLLADEEYGRSHTFRQEVATYEGLLYMVEVPCSLSGWTKRPSVLAPTESPSSRGRRRTRPRLGGWAAPTRRVDRLWKRGGPSWETFHVKETQKGPVVWEVRTTRFYPWEEGLPGEEQWLLIAHNVLTDEVKYFLSNAPQETAVIALVHVAFARWHIERVFEDAKGQVGLDHFEVRHYQPVMRHLILSMVSLLFLMRETHQAAKKKAIVECAPPAPDRRRAAGSRIDPSGTPAQTAGASPAYRLSANSGTESATFASKSAMSKTTKTRYLDLPTAKMFQPFLALSC